MSKDNLWIINPWPVKHLLQFINLWEKLWSYLQHACLVTWPFDTLPQDGLKGGPPTGWECTHWEQQSRSQITKQRLREEPQRDHHEDRTRRRRHRRAGPRMDIRGRPRGGKAHLFGLSLKSKKIQIHVLLSLVLSPFWFSAPLAGKRPDFLSGGSQKAAGAVSQRRRHGAAKPPTPDQPRVAVQRPHAPAGVCAPVQAEERLCIVRQAGWEWRRQRIQTPVITEWKCSSAELHHLLFFFSHCSRRSFGPLWDLRLRRLRRLLDTPWTSRAPLVLRPSSASDLWF